MEKSFDFREGRRVNKGIKMIRRDLRLYTYMCFSPNYPKPVAKKYMDMPML